MNRVTIEILPMVCMSQSPHQSDRLISAAMFRVYQYSVPFSPLGKPRPIRLRWVAQRRGCCSAAADRKDLA